MGRGWPRRPPPALAAPAMEGRGPGPGPGPGSGPDRAGRAGRAAGRAGGARAWGAFLVAGGALLGLLLVSLLLVDPDFDPELPAAGQAGAGAGAGEGARGEGLGSRRDAGTGAVTSVAFSGRRPEGTARTGARFRIHILDGLPRGLVGGLLPGGGAGACEGDYAGREVLLPTLVAASDVYEPEVELADFVPLQTECLLQELLAAGRDLTDATAVVNKVFGGFMDPSRPRRLDGPRLRGGTTSSPSPQSAGLPCWTTTTVSAFERVSSSRGSPSSPASSSSTLGRTS